MTKTHKKFILPLSSQLRFLHTVVYRGVYNWSEMIGWYKVSLTPSTKIINRQTAEYVSFLTQCLFLMVITQFWSKDLKKKKVFFLFHISQDGNLDKTPINYFFYNLYILACFDAFCEVLRKSGTRSKNNLFIYYFFLKKYVCNSKINMFHWKQLTYILIN